MNTATTVNGPIPTGTTQQAHTVPQSWPPQRSLQAPAAANPAPVQPAQPPMQGWTGQPGVPAAEPARRFDFHGEGFLTSIAYVFAAIMATIGGAEVLAPKLHWPVWIAGLAWLGFETLGVVFLVYAARRQTKGEKALSARGLSMAFAVGIATLNFTGHYIDNIWLACLFAGASVGAYVIFLLRTGAKARDTAEAEGRREPKPPKYPLWERITNRKRTELAMEIMSRNPGLDLAAARLAAIDHPVMLQFVRQYLLNEELEPATETQPAKRRTRAEVDGILRALQPHTLVAMFAEKLGPYREQMVDGIVAKSFLGSAGVAAARRRMVTVSPTGSAPARAGGGARPNGRPTARGAVANVVERRSKQSPQDTLNDFLAAAKASPGATQLALTEQLGISDGRWRAIKRELRDQGIEVTQGTDGVFVAVQATSSAAAGG